MKLNMDSINIAISIIGQVGTFITIVLVFFTLKEMEKQRRESYKPVIVIPRFGLVSEGNEKENFIVFDNLNRGGIFDEEEQKSHLHPETIKENKYVSYSYMELFNLGTGAAKDIVVEWKLEFDLSEIVKNLNEFFLSKSIPLIIELDKGNLVVLEKLSLDNSIVRRRIIDTGKENFDYLLPHSIEPLGLRLTLPIAYTKLITLLATTFINGNLERNKYDLPIRLDINYLDISEKHCRNQYQLRMVKSLIISKETLNAPSFYCSIEAKRIK